MKRKGCGPQALGSPCKQIKRPNMTKNIKRVPKKEQSFISSAMDYISGKQGYVPDMLTGGKPTRQAMNESTLFNPKTSSETLADMSDTRTHSQLLSRKNKGEKFDAGTQRYYDYYSNKRKQTRPNREDRY